MRPLLTPLLVLSLAVLPAAGARAAVGDLFVSSDFFDVTTTYDGGTGVQIGPFTSSVLGTGELGVSFGGPFNRVLIGHFTGGVDEFDVSTGGYVKTYNTGGGTQWAGIYAPNGNVYIGSWSTHDVREYDSTTGAFVGVLTPAPFPADLRIGLNGNLYICGYGDSSVTEVNASSGAFVSQWNLPFGSRTNDIAFLPGGEILVTAMGTNALYRYDAAHNLIGTYSGTGWMRPHGIDISPFDGNIYVADGVTQQVHVFDSATFLELNPAFLSPTPSGKIVDVIFRPPDPVAVEPTSWGRVKALQR